MDYEEDKNKQFAMMVILGHVAMIKPHNMDLPNSFYGGMAGAMINEG